MRRRRAYYLVSVTQADYEDKNKSRDAATPDQDVASHPVEPMCRIVADEIDRDVKDQRTHSEPLNKSVLLQRGRDGGFAEVLGRAWTN